MISETFFISVSSILSVSYCAIWNHFLSLYHLSYLFLIALSKTNTVIVTGDRVVLLRHQDPQVELPRHGHQRGRHRAGDIRMITDMTNGPDLLGDVMHARPIMG